ncbi:serine-type endopeptidase [Aureococcus anophagefferens]|nr:serine-type endopeptidase [Aureococcus anophagefferens]
MVSLHAALVALALTTSADAARNRRLQDNLDVPKLYEDAEEGKLSSRVLFKIDEAHRGDAAAVADKVASILECDAAPRVFREGGKFEAAHKAAGLDLHYQMNIWRNEARCGGDGVDNDGNGYVDDATAQPRRRHGHGPARQPLARLHCGGTIAADNNGAGVAGVAGGDGRRLRRQAHDPVGFGKTAVDWRQALSTARTWARSISNSRLVSASVTFFET